MSFRDITSGSFTPSAAGQSFNATVPATAAVGDTLIFVASIGVTSTTFSTPTGWTLAGSASATSMTTVVFRRVCQAGDAGANIAFVSSTAAIAKWSFVVAAYSGDDTTTPFDVALAIAGNTTATTSHSTPATTAATTSGGTIVEIVSDKGSPSSTSFTAPSGFTSRQFVTGSGAGITSIAIGDGGSTTTSTSGSTAGGNTWTAQASLQSVSATIILRPGITSAAATGTGALTVTGAATARAASTGTASLAFTAAATGGSVTVRAASGTATLALTASATGDSGGTTAAAISWAGGATGVHGQTGSAGAATTPITIPAGTQGGDVLILRVAYNNAATLTAPTGWALIHAPVKATETQAVYWRYATGGFGAASPDAGSGVTCSFSAINQYSMTLDVYRGCDQTNPIHAQSSSTETTATTTHVPPTVTTTAATWIVKAVSDKGAPSSTSYTASATLRSTCYGTGTASSSIATADSNANVATGTVGGGWFTGTLSTVTATMSTIALLPGVNSSGGGGNTAGPAMMMGAYATNLSGFTSLETALGQRMGIRRIYDSGPMSPTSAAFNDMKNDFGVRASWLSVKGNGTVAQWCSDMVNGVYDAGITAALNAVPADHILLLTFFHEPEDVTGGVFAPAFRHFYTLVKSVRPQTYVGPVLQGWTFNPASGRDLNSYNPGASYCDFFGIDDYNRFNYPSGSSPSNIGKWQDFSAINIPLYAKPWIDSVMPGKPMAIGELATAEFDTTVMQTPPGQTATSNKPQWINDAITYLDAHNTLAVCWFSIYKSGDTTPTMILNSTTASTQKWASFQVAHPNGVNDVQQTSSTVFATATAALTITATGTARGVASATGTAALSLTAQAAGGTVAAMPTSGSAVLTFTASATAGDIAVATGTASLTLVASAFSNLTTWLFTPPQRRQTVIVYGRSLRYSYPVSQTVWRDSNGKWHSQETVSQDVLSAASWSFTSPTQVPEQIAQELIAAGVGTVTTV